MAKNDKVVKRGVYLYLDGSEIKNDIQSVEKEMRGLVSMQKKMVVGSEEYVRAGQKIRALKGIIAGHNAQLRETENQVKKNTVSFGKFVDGFNRFFGIIGAAIAALTGFTLAIRSLRDEKNKLEESQAGLQALTGLDDESITWLTAQAKKLSTTMTKEGLRVRQSANEILDAFMLVGSAKPELLGDKEALAAVTEEAMRLQAAAKDITLTEAVDALTLSLNQYGDQADQARRYVNALAAGSKEGAVNIASQANAIQKAGTIAASSNIPIEELIGSIEMLGEKGIKDEIAGTGLKTFFTRLATGAVDTNPKVVGLTTALENLNRKVQEAEKQQVGGGTTLLKKLFGDEGMQTAMILTQNTDKVKAYTEAVTGTNIAFEQSAINSNTAAAKLAQAKNEMKLAGIELAERLNPAITVSTNMATNLIKYLPGVLDWFKKWGSEALVCAGYFLLLGTRTMLVTKVTVAYHAVLSAGRTLMIAYRVAVEAVNIALVGGVRNLVALRTAMVASNVTTKVIAATTTALRGVYFLLTGQIALAGKAFRALRVVMAGGWVGVALTAVAAVTLALITMNKKMSETERNAKIINDLNKKTSDQYDREAAKIDMLIAKIHNNNLSLNERRKAIHELNQIIPGYLARIDDEGKLHEGNKKALDDYLTSLEKEIKMKVYSDELTELYRKRREQRKVVNKVQGYVDSSQKAYDVTQYQDLNSHVTAGQILTKYKDKLVDVQKELAETDSLIKALNEEISQDDINKPITPDKVDPDDEQNGGGNGDDKKKKKKRIEKELLAIEEKYALEREKLQNEFLSKRNMTQEEYEQFGRDLEEQSLNEKLNVLGLEEKKRLEIQNKILSLRDKFQKECSTKDEKEYKERQKSMEDGLDQQLDTYKRGLQEQLYAGDINQKEQKKIYLQYLSDLYDEVKDNPLVSDEFKKKMSIALSDEQLAEQKESYDKATENLNTLKNRYMDIGQAFGQAMGDFFESEEKSLEQFLAKILVTVLDALEKQLIAQQAAAIGSVTITSLASSLTVAGALAKAAAKIALITAAFETAKGVLGGFASGGYTGSGAWNEPKGIVHSNEFVSNRFAVSNPSLRPVFDLIDYAQRTGTVANLTSDDVAAVLSTRAPSGSTTPSDMVRSNPSESSVDPAIIKVMTECVKVMRAVKDRFNNPIVAETYATGRRGTIEAEKLVDKMNTNASRRIKYD